MAFGVDFYQDQAEGGMINGVGATEAVPGYSSRNVLKWLLGGAIAGLVIGGVVIAIGADQLDACAVKDCLSSAIDFGIFDGPFSGDRCV